MTFLELHKWYLFTDVMLLCDLWRWYSNLIHAEFEEHPCNYITGASLSYGAALKMGATNLEPITDLKMYSELESMLRGGLTSVVKRLCEPNNVDMGGAYNPAKVSKHMVLVDWNSLYGCMLTKPLPYGSFKYMNNPET